MPECGKENNSELPEPRYDEELMECRKLTLSFYSSEINTHGALILGFSVIIFTLVEILIRLKQMVTDRAIQQVHPLQSIILYLGILLADWGLWYLIFRYITYGSLADYATRTKWVPPTSEYEGLSRVEIFECYVSKDVKTKTKFCWLIRHFTGSSWQGMMIALACAILTTILLAVVLDFSWFVAFLHV
jgi:hypothetical protein